MGWFDKLRSGLKKTREGFKNKLKSLLAAFGKVDEDLFDELEELLITSDFGVETTEHLMEKLRARVKEGRIIDAAEVEKALQEEIAAMLTKGEQGLDTEDVPVIISVIGVNGVGKTTSIGKMAHLYKSAGKRVLLAAGDTFRAAAIDQLGIWAERAGVEMVSQSEGADPAAVLFDACRSAKAKGVDVLICDTAGRLHNKKNLMDELAKMNRVVEREMAGVRHETFLVLDAATGQNAVNQARAFSEVAGITGIILTKLDGSSKGGIIVSICEELGIPVRLVGVGEGINDLQPFVPEDYVRALFEG
ncbi:MAG: signal recognition particle-docking protein FtsY [Clostridia bacterium]|nr:signal recognition particle-docking protein FtsY [Clostridia bacterium]MBR0159091.1 signal recognition particle-docking protein FtsY [Clostridia bacterium]MBR7062557.1 signal recognition particle-docking protein FtsY [Clostridia bacterium]